MFQLTGKTAIVTGGGSGIGLAIATVLAKQGARVVVWDIDEKGAAACVQKITEAGGDAYAAKIDLSVQAQVTEAAQAVQNRYGSIDILINNAGVAHIGTADTTSEADFTRLFSINVKGVYNCLHACIPFMKNQKAGVVLNMCSIAASVGIPDRFAYSMSKGAVLGMTLSAAKDYLAYNIRVNCISPARIYTPFVQGFLQANYAGREKEMFENLSKSQPIGRMGTPEEVAHLALYLCSDEAAFITGCDYPIDGGFIKLNN